MFDDLHKVILDFTSSNEDHRFLFEKLNISLQEAFANQQQQQQEIPSSILKDFALHVILQFFAEGDSFLELLLGSQKLTILNILQSFLKLVALLKTNSNVPQLVLQLFQLKTGLEDGGKFKEWLHEVVNYTNCFAQIRMLTSLIMKGKEEQKGEEGNFDLLIRELSNSTDAVERILMVDIVTSLPVSVLTMLSPTSLQICIEIAKPLEIVSFSSHSLTYWSDSISSSSSLNRIDLEQKVMMKCICENMESLIPELLKSVMVWVLNNSGKKEVLSDFVTTFESLAVENEKIQETQKAINLIRLLESLRQLILVQQEEVPSFTLYEIVQRHQKVVETIRSDTILNEKFTSALNINTTNQEIKKPIHASSTLSTSSDSKIPSRTDYSSTTTTTSKNPSLSLSMLVSQSFNFKDEEIPKKEVEKQTAKKLPPLVPDVPAELLLYGEDEDFIMKDVKPYEDRRVIYEEEKHLPPIVSFKNDEKKQKPVASSSSSQKKQETFVFSLPKEPINSTLLVFNNEENELVDEDDSMTVTRGHLEAVAPVEDERVENSIEKEEEPQESTSTATTTPTAPTSTHKRIVLFNPKEFLAANNTKSTAKVEESTSVPTSGGSSTSNDEQIVDQKVTYRQSAQFKSVAFKGNFTMVQQITHQSFDDIVDMSISYKHKLIIVCNDTSSGKSGSEVLFFDLKTKAMKKTLSFSKVNGVSIERDYDGRNDALILIMDGDLVCKYDLQQVLKNGSSQEPIWKKKIDIPNRFQLKNQLSGCVVLHSKEGHAHNTLFVCDGGQNCVHVLNCADGRYWKRIGGPNTKDKFVLQHPNSIDIVRDSSQLIISEHTSKTVRVLLESSETKTTETLSLGFKKFGNVGAVVYDNASKNMIVSDLFDNSIQIFNMLGSRVSIHSENLHRPKSMCINEESGELLINDSGNKRIIIFK